MDDAHSGTVEHDIPFCGFEGLYDTLLLTAVLYLVRADLYCLSCGNGPGQKGTSQMYRAARKPSRNICTTWETDSSSSQPLITPSPLWIWMDNGRQKILETSLANILTAPQRCPWIKEALEALSDSCTIFLVQGIYFPSEALFTPSPTRTARPAIRFRGAWLEMVLAHTVKMSSHPQESARKKCSMLL